MGDQLKLLQILNSRICHEIAGSINTISNCVSLINNKSKSIRSEAQQLLHQESEKLIRKIQYFRECYGLSENEHGVDITFLSKLINDFFSDDFIGLTLNFDDEVQSIESSLFKAILCLLSVIKDSLNSSAKLDVFFRSQQEIKILISEDNLKQLKESFAVIKQYYLQDIEITINNCRECYINILLGEAGYKLEIQKANGALECKLVRK